MSRNVHRFSVIVLSAADNSAAQCVAEAQRLHYTLFVLRQQHESVQAPRHAITILAQIIPRSLAEFDTAKHQDCRNRSSSTYTVNQMSQRPNVSDDLLWEIVRTQPPFTSTVPATSTNVKQDRETPSSCRARLAAAPTSPVTHSTLPTSTAELTLALSTTRPFRFSHLATRA